MNINDQNDEELKALCESYLRHYKMQYGSTTLEENHQQNNKRKAKINQLNDSVLLIESLINQDAEKALKIIIYLLKIAQNDAEIAYIAAGPLENFLNKHPNKKNDELIKLVRKNKKMRKAIQNVWINKTDPGFSIYSKLMEYI